MSRYVFPAVAVCFLMVSCAGGPERGSPPVPFPAEGARTAAPETPAPAGKDAAETEGAETALPFPETPLADVPLVEPEEAPPAAESAEPALDAAEADVAELPPVEAPVVAALPEPEAGPVERVLPAEPAGEQVPPDEPLPPPAISLEPAGEQVLPDEPLPPPAAPVEPAAPPSLPATPPPVPPPVPPPAPREAPRPPAYLGPAGEERPSVLAREIPSVPASPPPAPPPDVIIPLPEPREGEIAFSRIVRATVGQLVEIPFRGTGWVYLGELGSRRGIVYDSRRLDPEGQSFVFRIEAAGTYALKFFKQDFIRDFILNDHVQVLAGEAPDSAGAGWFNQPLERGRVRAEPRWPSSLEEAERIRRGTPTAAGTASAANTQAGESPAGTAGTAGIAGIGPGAAPPAQTAAAAPERPVVTERPAVTETGSARAPVPVSEAPADMTAPGFLQKARDEFEAGRIASAISLLDQLRERYPSGSDEAYWLYGQFYEANSPSRDILTALDYYRRLVREYPQSGRFNDARRRIAYLERYYIFNN